VDARERRDGGARALRRGSVAYETLYSSLGRPEGVAVLADAMSTDIQEHAYWGGMRDRIPKSQTDALTPAGAPTHLRDGPTIRVMPAENICLIRSGQDWTDTDSDERAMYVNDVEPVLRMMFLQRDEALQRSKRRHQCRDR
jgi:aldoxime dehydratase